MKRKKKILKNEILIIVEESERNMNVLYLSWGVCVYPTRDSDQCSSRDRISDVNRHMRNWRNTILLSLFCLVVYKSNLIKRLICKMDEIFTYFPQVPAGFGCGAKVKAK